jgi:hypothetical protein
LAKFPQPALRSRLNQREGTRKSSDIV